jgi:cytochrome c553
MGRRLMLVMLKIFGALLAMVVLAVIGLLVAAEVRFDRPRDVALPAIERSSDPAVIAHGEYLVHGPAGCSMCHGAADEVWRAKAGPKPALQGGFVFSMPGFGTFRPANLTPDETTGLGRRTPAQIARTIRHGVHADGSIAPFMAIHASAMADDDLQAVVSYLLSTPAVKQDAGENEMGAIGKILFAFAFEPAQPTPLALAPAAAPTVERGEYLAERVALCVFCHTQHDPISMEESAPSYTGGQPNPAYDLEAGAFTSPNEFAAPNITPHEGGALARFNEESFLARFRAGKLIPNSPMPWQTFGNMTDDDVRAIYRYLQTVPAVANDTGPTLRKIGWQPGQPTFDE